VRLGARPDRILLRAGQHRNGLREFGVRGQRAVRGQVGAQNVGQHQRVAGIGLAPRDRVPIPIPRHRHRVDREHRAPGSAQAGHQQTPAGLDRHRDRRLLIIARVGQHLQQRGEPGRVVTDAALGQQGAILVDQRDVVMVLGAIDPAEHRHRHDPPTLSKMTTQARARSRTWGWSLLQGTRAP
jgi:hypothetical protein